MAKAILTVLLILLLNVLVGCHGVDSGASQLIPSNMKAAATIDASESDIVEQMAINRQAYRQGLESLIAHYNKAGNHMKLAWAENELKRLDKMPQYNYIIEAIVAGPGLKAKNSIAEAELKYLEASNIEKKARRLIFLVNEDLLRTALDKYNQLIKKHPSSDRIDDAAYRAAGIFEHFKDYTLAILYYQRAYQWDPDTIHPARFKAAYLLDTQLRRRAEALEIYKEAVKDENLSEERREIVQRRIRELSGGGKAK
ncbi:MAG: hypothetical protein KAS75_07845 [Planctomycetes bacterium]|nr:hypothetical protein [Planctomycetota bacterium]